MATAKRAYKLQEFVAHSSNVNCLKIGRRTSRVLVTGGEDHKVNLWAIGKPNAILSLSGHTSAIESVSFDSSEVLVAAGAASGTIKLWDLEEAKIVRTLTGHRSNCVSVDFHPFGEFFASGSLDTNLKIWDIRRKGCIHTYKGHTRGVNAIRFTPDGRWVVSGGEDNVVKLWDLTAGKLLHEFKCHEGQIQCIDFHPHEFLLATGSADKTVKFWDLETFELIGSAGPETSGVRSITFNPDGRTLLCGLHESLKVFSWEPVRCYDTVDVGWSRLSDLNIHEGKLLGCSYNQSCVGVWVVDISRVEPYAITTSMKSNGHSESKSTTGNSSLQTENSMKTSMGRLSISQNSEPVAKETKSTLSSGSVAGTPQRIGLSMASRATGTNSATSTTTLKRSSAKSQGTTNVQVFNKSDVVPVIVPRNSFRPEAAPDSRKEATGGRMPAYNGQSKPTDFRKLPNTNIREDPDRESVSTHSVSFCDKNIESNEVRGQDPISSANAASQPLGFERNMADLRFSVVPKTDGDIMMEPRPSYRHENFDIRVHKPRDTNSMEASKAGRTRSLVASWERRDQSPSHEGPTPSTSSDKLAPSNSISYTSRGRTLSSRKEMVSASDEDAIADLIEPHEQFLNAAQSRLTKLQVVHRLWQRNDIRGVINALENMSDHAVSADVLSVLMDKLDIINLDIFTFLIPILTSLMEGKVDRHVGISLEMLLKLVKIFGPVIHSTLSAGPMVGVDIQAEQRLEKCNLCFIELEKVKRRLPSLTRRGGSISKSAQELNLTLQEVI
ncbi:katanin p80 WD40 repeat-containing subunit B1 homolog KTN80.4-like [Dioscorea cayenensis subsp. rotundata]|uniref:Katanin p80 WD40 repeat-containing subunit B1 homolog n=1 Tax=Dioscorea cayennensis subsp. rotundata TaxID=55577 RepID=A0AB40C598_DIOCR|nr:katanin p80 WD40 repeat-containing subunit B1 homolog KTN80.4-like [Dioscorea cayenensis subsp. rotundata]